MLKLLALKGPNFAKEKLQFVQTQVQYLEHLKSEQGLLPHPDRLHGVLNFLKPKTKHKQQGFLRLFDYCQKWILNLSMAKLLCILLSGNNPDPILWKEPEDIAFKVLKESLMNPWHLNDQTPFFSFSVSEGRECP